MIVAFQFMILSQNHTQLLFDILKSHHPLLVNYRSINIDRDLERHFKRYLNRNLHRHLYPFLNDGLSRIVYIDWFIDINGFIQVYWLLDFNVDWLLDDFWWAFDLNINFFLHFHYFLNNPFWPWNILGHLNSNLNRLFNNNFFNRLFGHSPILIFQLSFQYLNLSLKLILISLQPIDTFLMIPTLFISFPQMIDFYLKFMSLFL